MSGSDTFMKIPFVDAERDVSRQIIGRDTCAETSVPTDMPQDERNVVLVVSALRASLSVSAQDISDETGVALEMVQGVLNKMEDSGLLTKETVYLFNDRPVKPIRDPLLQRFISAEYK